MNIKKDKAEKVVQKFQMTRMPCKHHKKWELRYQGKRVLTTYYSFGSGDMGKVATSKFRSQLKLNQSQLREAIRCPFTFEDYIESLKDRGVIKSGK